MKKREKKLLVLSKETVRTMAAVQGGSVFSVASPCWEGSGDPTGSCHHSNYVDCWYEINTTAANC